MVKNTYNQQCRYHSEDRSNQVHIHNDNLNHFDRKLNHLANQYMSLHFYIDLHSSKLIAYVDNQCQSIYYYLNKYNSSRLILKEKIY